MTERNCEKRLDALGRNAGKLVKMPEPPGIDSLSLNAAQRREYLALWAEIMRETFSRIGKAIDQACADVSKSQMSRRRGV